MTIVEKVLAEVAKFEAQLPELLQTRRGLWVVFLHGQVQSVHPTEDAALADARENFAEDTGYVIAQVVPRAAQPITAAMLFG